MRLMIAWLLAALAILVNLVSPVYGQGPPSYEATGSSGSSPSTSINAFELFWPVTAGKTIDDPTYFLKSLKENLRGVIIFGNTQKADYDALLATKRLLEAEVLMNAQKYELADKTLVMSIDKVKAANSRLRSVTKNKSTPEVFEIKNKVSNMMTYLDKIKFNQPRNQAKINELLLELTALSQTIPT